jgi:ribosomal protein S18 acetylase RimI-like enzyme
VVAESASEVFVAQLEVDPTMQGQGIGTELLRRVIRDAERRMVPVVLEVLQANPRARELYERLGFVVTDEYPPRFRMVRELSTASPRTLAVGEEH